MLLLLFSLCIAIICAFFFSLLLFCLLSCNANINMDKLDNILLNWNFANKFTTHGPYSETWAIIRRWPCISCSQRYHSFPKYYFCLWVLRVHEVVSGLFLACSDQGFGELKMDQGNKKSCGVKVGRLFWLLFLLCFPWDDYWHLFISLGKARSKEKSPEILVFTSISTSLPWSFPRVPPNHAGSWRSREWKMVEKHKGK